ncbi:MAG: histidine phosphatase family protein [Saprospiraceae bacterium]|nr:histidine phosphatase family protein [Saprospiraceae bacterium]
MYILRHGQTDFNKRGVVQGSGIDAPLNETGRLQAKAFHNTYKSIDFDRIYVSNLQRTHQTVGNFVEDGYELIKLAGFNEINWGAYEGKSMTPESNAYYSDMSEKWSNGDVHLPIEGGESPLEVKERIDAAMKDVMNAENEKTVLICMHGRAMRILLSSLLGYPLSLMDMFPHHNVGFYRLLHTGNMFRVMQFNEYGHLNGLA